MKLYVLEVGILRGDKGDYVAGATGIQFDVPVPYFLMEHQRASGERGERDCRS